MKKLDLLLVSVVSAAVGGLAGNLPSVHAGGEGAGFDLPITEAQGGTNQTSYTKGDFLYASAANTLSKLAIGSTSNILRVSGGIPAWQSLTPSSVSTSNAGGTNFSPASGTTPADVSVWDTQTVTGTGITHSTSSSQQTFTLNVAGTVIVTGNLRWNLNATGVRNVQISPSTANVQGLLWTTPGSSSGVSDVSFAETWICAASDTFKIQGWQNSGSTISTQTSNCRMMVILIPD